MFEFIWMSFRTKEYTKEDMRYIYTNFNNIKKLYNKEWFNKATENIEIYSGYETEKYKTNPISEKIYLIRIEYQIKNYFGELDGLHYRSKDYILIDNKFYKQDKGDGIEVKRMTKELKGILSEIKKGENE